MVILKALVIKLKREASHFSHKPFDPWKDAKDSTQLCLIIIFDVPFPKWHETNCRWLSAEISREKARLKKSSVRCHYGACSGSVYILQNQSYYTELCFPIYSSYLEPGTSKTWNNGFKYFFFFSMIGLNGTMPFILTCEEKHFRCTFNHSYARQRRGRLFDWMIQVIAFQELWSKLDAKTLIWW